MANQHKKPMYECQAFFPDTHPKRWKYVTDLKGFSGMLSRDHSSWRYFNVYEKETKKYLKRFYPGHVIPKVLGLLLFCLLTLKFTFGIKTPALPATSMKTPVMRPQAPLTNGIYNSATISILSPQNSILC